MARQVLPIVGAVVGAYFGYPQLGFMVGSILGQVVDPAVAQGPQLGELPVQTSNEGQPRAIIYGTATCTGYILAFGEAIKTTETVTGEKGAPKTDVNVVYRCYAVAICEAPAEGIGGILRCWENDKLVYDVRTGSLMLAESEQWMANKFFHNGAETQTPNVFMEQTISGVGTTPAYRGTAYMYFNLEDLTDTAGAIKQYRWEVASSESYTPSGDTLAPLIAADMWRAQTFSATLSAYSEVEVDAVYLSGNLQANAGPYGDLIECYEDGPPENNTWRCSYLPANVQNFATAVIKWRKAPPGFTHVVGTAKQLAQVEYRSSLLYQEGHGPVLLPGDPDYNNATFWAAQRALAISAGTLHADVASPVEVPEYAIHPNPATGTGAPVVLSAIVGDLCDRVTLPAEDFDASELTDMVTGLTITGDYTAGDAINTLRSCYFFDKAEPGDKLYFPKRGKPVVMTLDFDDIVDVPDLSKREQVGEVPKKLHLMYQHPTAGYAPVKATFERSSVDIKTVAEATMQVPVVLDENEAKQMVHKQSKVMVAEAQGEIKLTLPERLISLIPSDNIGLSLRGQVRRLRIDESEWADGILSQTLRVDRQSAYTSNLTGIAVPEPTLPPSTIVGGTTFVFADVPSRSDSEDDLHYLVAGVGALPGWYGWQLQRSLDAGANYESVEQFTAADVMGSLVDDVPAASEHYTDTTSTVRVQLYNSNHALEDLAEAQFLSEGGAFLLEKADGGYEVMQYRDATDEGSGIFALTHLHRGRLNSGAAAHLVGAKFVMLEDMTHVPAQSAWIGQSLTHRPVSLGETPESATPQTNAYAGRSQLEWPVASLTLARSVANIVTGSWAPRHRFGTDDAPVASSNFQGYRVTIVGSSTVTFDQASNLLSYDASALGASVVVSVQALNRITGAGPATSGTI